jgi:ATP-dependent Clp protease adaptor protein ClpS
MTDVATDIKIDEKIKVDITEPKKYNVIFLNDDKTPIEFVIELLTSLFKHSDETAKQLTLTVHNEGSAVVGVYNFEIAEQKGVEATSAARAAGFPLIVKVDVE